MLYHYHQVVFYKSKQNIKVGYLTGSDENILANINGRKTIKETIIIPLQEVKYEHDLRQLLEGDVETMLLFLRNTSFGQYILNLTDPKQEIVLKVRYC